MNVFSALRMYYTGPEQTGETVHIRWNIHTMTHVGAECETGISSTIIKIPKERIPSEIMLFRLSACETSGVGVVNKQRS